MYYILEDEIEKVELEVGSTDIFDYMGESIFRDEFGMLQEYAINDTFLTEYDWFEDVEDYDKINAYRKGTGCTWEEAFDQWEEAYQGEFDSDAEFAESQAESLGYIDRELTWPFNCIDWEDAAKDLMHDYFEQDGHYFRYQ